MRPRAGLVPILVLLLAAACGPGGRSPTDSSPTARPPETIPPESTPDAPPLSEVQVRLVRVADLNQPLALAVRPDDDALYIAERVGRVVALRDGEVEPIVDLTGEVSLGGEQGLLGLVFSPDGRFLYVNYTDLQGDTHVTEFAMGRSNADLSSRRDVLFVDQPYANHNGGNLAFGPDGYLYVGLGDGGSAGDPMDNGQSLGTRLGKMLRIDPRPTEGKAFGIPPDNPFRGQRNALPEIWAYGLRNPWRWSFDRETGDLWIGDVGQSAREEIDFQPASSGGGENYGWDGYEGRLIYEEPVPEEAVPPVYDYPQDLGASVIGGYVYRGSEIEGLQGAYLLGDFYNPQIRILKVRDSEVLAHRELGVQVPSLASFGEDADGELYALSLAGPVYRLAPA
jgi:glucose/arabinose dehydrogenase